MKKKNILLIAVLCIIYTNSRAQKDSTIDVAKNLCSCLDEVTIKKDKLEKIIATAKDRKIAEIDNHAEQLEILDNLFNCMNKLTKDKLWLKENNRSLIYEYVKNNCPNYKGLIIFDNISTKNNADAIKNEIENKKTAIDFRNMAFEAFDKDDMFYVKKYCRKAIELDTTNKEKDIIEEHFFKIGKDWLNSADNFEKKGEITIARKYRSDAHLPLILALEFGSKKSNDIGNTIYNNLIMLGDKVGANLYKHYKK